MTSAPATDLWLHYETFLTLVGDAIAPDGAYEFGKVPGADGNPGTFPDRYALVDVQRRYVDPATLAGLAGTSGWVVTVVGVGRTTREVSALLNRVTGAIEESRVDLDGHTSTPLTHEATDPIQLDDGLFAGRMSWTYSL